MAVASSHKTVKKADRPGDKLLNGAWPWVLIALTILLVYLRTVSFGFTYFDDESLVLNNLEGLSSLKNILLGFSGELTKGFTAFYRPLLTASFILNFQLSGLAAWGYHLVNVLLHLAACLLFYELLRKLNAGPGRALFFSLLFSVHPKQHVAGGICPADADVFYGLHRHRKVSAHSFEWFVLCPGSFDQGVSLGAAGAVSGIFLFSFRTAETIPKTGDNCGPVDSNIPVMVLGPQ